MKKKKKNEQPHKITEQKETARTWRSEQTGAM